MATAFPPDIQVVVDILAAARARRIASEGCSTVTRADESLPPRAPPFEEAS
jgi:hypothetical protein